MCVSREERNGLTKEYLNELFEYRDGKLYWKVQKGCRGKIGAFAGTDNGKGYLKVQIDGVKHFVHRIVWIMHYGEAPKRLDHKDTNKLNNRIENLRPATGTENGLNRGAPKHNTSGIKGVSWHKKHGKWYVCMKVLGKQKFFGLFEDIELAELVAIEAREKYHGEFARHS